MRDHDPPRVRRLLMLRQVPGLAEAELGELAAFAENVVERAFAPGAVVATAAQPAAIHLVVDGQLGLSGVERSWGARQLFGAHEAIAGRGAPGTVVALAPTRTLELAPDDLRELLEDNPSVMASTRRALAGQLLAAAAPAPAGLVASPGAAGELTMVERLIALRRALGFTRGSLQAFAALALASLERRHPAGARLHEPGAHPDGVRLVIDGVARVRRPGHPDGIVAGGGALGRLETLAEAPLTAAVEALTPMRVLYLPAPALFDVMEDHTDFALALLAALAGAVLDHGRDDAGAFN